MARWTLVCQVCWYNLFPDQYLPTYTTLDTCSQCGYTDQCVNVNPKDIEKESN